MKISIIPTDAAYSTVAWRAQIFFNGRIIKEVVSADTDKGTVIVNRKDDFGKYILNPDGRVLRKEMFGRVQISWPDSSLSVQHEKYQFDQLDKDAEND